MDIERGTLVEGVPAGAFVMPPGMTVRYERLAPELTDFFTGVHVYAAHGPAVLGQVDWFLPGTANVRIAIDAGPIAIRIGSARFAPMPPVALFGPTSHVLEAETNGGIMIGFGVSALGWSRLARRPAWQCHNQIQPLAANLGRGLETALFTGLSALSNADEVKPFLDEILAARLDREPNPDEPLIRAFQAMVLDDCPVEIAAAAARLAVSIDVLRRLARRYFGMPPKLLLRRARFLRSLVRLMAADDATNYDLIDRSYFDASHFLRDANTFLGMTPRRFMAMPTPFLDASLRARAAVLGTATQALHPLSVTAPAPAAPPLG